MNVFAQFPKHMSSGGFLPHPSKEDRVKPKEGQESVWDYPRPPVCKEAKGRKVVLKLGNKVIAETERAWRMMETSHPPTWYIPKEDINMKYLKPSQAMQTTCEFKGQAMYYDVEADGKTVKMTGWSYPRPADDQKQIKDKFAFYINRGLEAWVDGKKAKPQEGDFYGGWITADVVGPFKGAQELASGDERRRVTSIVRRGGSARSAGSEAYTIRATLVAHAATTSGCRTAMCTMRP
eukprot:CAMPEP_0170181634 /NCGR_PEP_ID=MMETSP0040_2-20121228/25624_1 /TAXON_ID=641309 /ORGANISM="Lotharella oceanica, Strain CCMP622" /LENGTH=235 /DNA_ID=CAMNT_0010426753 /DNA_START=41 /DNA_END=745 /DNA_ORIENTATION=-